MKQLAVIAALAVVPACVDGSPEVKNPNEVPTEGGTITVAQCGYDVTTRFGASAPQPHQAQFGTDPTPKFVHLGLGQTDASTSIVMQWRTVDEASLATTVQYGVGTNLDHSQDGFSFIYISGFNQNGQTIRMHETHLCGLTPDTEYSYRVGGVDGAGSESWSPTYTFRTAPVASADTEVVIANLGDSRDGFDILEDFVNILENDPPDLILFSGDAVTLGQSQDEWEVFFEVGEPLFARAPIVQAHGNHDANAINFYSQFAMPGNEENYGVDYGPVHVTVLNDNPLVQSDIEGAAADFLASDLAANQNRPWKLMMHHMPLWSASTRHGSDERLQAAWQPTIDQYHVDMVLAGHDHDYERSKPLNGSNVQASPATGTIYVVSGGAGAGLYTNGNEFWTETSAKSHSTVVIRARPGMLEYEAIREDGTMLDSTTLTK